MTKIAFLPGSGRRAFRFGNTRVAIRAPSDAGGIRVAEPWMPPGKAPPPHIHRRAAGIVPVRDGGMRIRIAGGDPCAGAGEWVRAPRGLPQGSRGEGAKGARGRAMAWGRVFEARPREAGRTAPAAGRPPATAIRRLAAIARHAVELIGALVAPQAGPQALAEGN